MPGNMFPIVLSFSAFQIQRGKVQMTSQGPEDPDEGEAKSKQQPTLGDKVPGYKISATAGGADCSHIDFHLQILWSVYSGKSLQPLGHLYTQTKLNQINV